MEVLDPDVPALLFLVLKVGIENILLLVLSEGCLTFSAVIVRFTISLVDRQMT